MVIQRRLRGESAAADTGKDYWTDTLGTVDVLATGQAGMKLLENRSLSQSKMGDDGARLINGLEDPGDQGSEIEILAAGSGTHLRRRNVEYR